MPRISLEDGVCPLCLTAQAREHCEDGRRTFYQCSVCSLIFVPHSQFLSEEDEKKRYDLHRNSPDDTGYRSFLSRLFVPLQERLSPGSRGLDFGCGPVPVLAGMFREAGHSAALYDRYYAPDQRVLDDDYDFITLCEVVEHLRDPAQELELLWSRLKTGGWLGIMTAFAPSPADFSNWHYKDDLTHIRFFSPETFAWLNHQWNAELIMPEKNVVLIRKKGRS